MTEYELAITPRELADLMEVNRQHQTNKVTIIWAGKKTYIKAPVPRWAQDLLEGWRKGTDGPITVDCPNCDSKAGTWCELGGRPRKNFLHDSRTFLHWERLNGRKIRERRR